MPLPVFGCPSTLVPCGVAAPGYCHSVSLKALLCLVLLLYWDYIWVIYWDYIGVMEKRMETTIESVASRLLCWAFCSWYGWHFGGLCCGMRGLLRNLAWCSRGSPKQRSNIGQGQFWSSWDTGRDDEELSGSLCTSDHSLTSLGPHLHWNLRLNLNPRPLNPIPLPHK